MVIVLVSQSYPTLCNRIDCSPSGSSVWRILQPRILEWLPFPSPGDLPNPGIAPLSPTCPALAGKFLNTSTTVATAAAKLLQSCLTLRDRMDCGLPGSSVHGFSKQEYWSGLPLPSPSTSGKPKVKHISILLPQNSTFRIHLRYMKP